MKICLTAKDRRSWHRNDRQRQRWFCKQNYGDTCISKLSHDEPPKIICRLYADRQFGSLQPEHKAFRHAHARPCPLIEELANFFVKSLHASKATRMSRNLCRGELPFLHELYTLMRDFFLARQVEQAQDVT